MTADSAGETSQPTQAGPLRLPLDRRTVIAGVLLPIGSAAVDFLILGQGILAVAPAGLLTAMLLGIGALLLSFQLERRVPALAVLTGAVAAAATVSVMVAVPLAALGVFGTFFAVQGLAGPWGLPLVLLGIGTLWTAWTYVRRAWDLIGRIRGDRAIRRPLLLFAAGAAAYVAAVGVVDLAERTWVASRVADITRDSPQHWPAALAGLSSYPLCGKLRCNDLVCDRLYDLFGKGKSTGSYDVPAVPPEHEALFAGYLGKRTGFTCVRVH